MKTKIKSHLVCKRCDADWPYSGGTIYTACPHCDNKIDARDRSGERKGRAADSKSLAQWRSQPGNRSASSRTHHARVRRRALFKVGGSIKPKCIRCGCDDSRLLEINHKELVGRNREHTGHGFFTAIVNGTYQVIGLEILCRPCNAIHYLEKKLGEPLPIKVIWYGGGKHGEPGAMPWMEEAYDVSCAEEEKVVTVRTFAAKK